ncbi:MAG: nucleotidyl transferase AbiEii/AbiGii toxin family protein [Chloroflexota bacterium]|nr:nucleotidyl transferase AbiEii/AbiGii toxin family protein [Chloroflexota bacterium]
MRYATAAASRAALEQRLLAVARSGDVPLVRLRKLVAFERLLARLMIVAPDRWVLEGAVALHLRLGARFRTTKDLDLGRWDDERAATDDLVAAEQVDLGDLFRFAVEGTATLDQLLEGAAARYHVSAYLAGRRFEEFSLDVGCGDPLTIEPERLRGLDLLSFAEIDATEIPTLPLEPHVAEKVHAYTRGYAGGHPSTRVKDLVRMATEVGLDPELFVGYEQARAFLDPILGGTVPDDATWHSDRWRW